MQNPAIFIDPESGRFLVQQENCTSKEKIQLK